MGLVVNAVVVFGLAHGMFRAIERLVGNRVAAEIEWNGLDEMEMGSNAYPRD
jgi:hypothetical protein